MFRDRSDAGRQLAARLGHLKSAQPVVLALPRGGIPIAAEIAKALDAPLDVVFVRKLGLPQQPELAVGAVVDGGHPEIVLNRDVVSFEGLSEADIAAIRERELEEIARRRRQYLGDRSPVSIEGRTAIVVDDGIATGATARVALKGVRHRKPKSIVLAVPVASPDVIERIRPEVDELVCLLQPRDLFAVGYHYSDFAQVSDEEVRETLARHREPRRSLSDSAARDAAP